MPGFDWAAYDALGKPGQQRHFANDYFKGFRGEERAPDGLQRQWEQYQQALSGHGGRPGMGPQPGNTGIVPPQAPATLPPQPLPQAMIAPQGMVGSSYGVQGAMPLNNSYGLPRY